MKKLLLILGLIILTLVWVYRPASKKDQASVEPQSPLSQQTDTAKSVNISKSLFVPYWSLESDSELDEYKRLIYFGISANTAGINQEEAGYTNLDQFDEISNPNQEKYLTLRLLDANTNLELLSNKDLQQKIINETITIANDHNYDGIVLDLELSILPIVDVTTKINTFVQNFYYEAQNNSIGFSFTMYGDTFYRNRPFDIKTMAKHSDEVMIMAYDFSKSYGEPGPNFPAQGNEEFGYDFETMMKDFSEVVPSHKLSVIFGMYGYDWTLGSQGKPLKSATAITLNQLNDKYIDNCKATNCQIKRNELSGETIVTYQDNEQYNHTIWSEDEDSVQKKINLINEFSGNVIYWANSYF